MLKKGKLWLADWRDIHGTRHRKGFASKKEAERYQATMQGEAGALKKAHASGGSARSARHGRNRRARRATTRKRPHSR